MSLLTKIRKQTIYIWQPGIKNKFNEVEFFEPFKLLARVEPNINEIINDIGKKQISTGKLYVDREIVPGSYIFIQPFEDKVDIEAKMLLITRPDTTSFCNKIIKSEIIPKIRYNDFLYLSYI